MPIEDFLRGLTANNELVMLVRVVFAGMLGVLVGIEREFEGKPAGARTYGGVALGAATFTIIGVIAFGVTDETARIVAQIVTGVGFLGAGTILHLRGRVIGLTTAAGMWVMAAVGMAVGFGQYLIGIGASVALFLMFQLLDPQRIVGRRGAAETAAHAYDDAEEGTDQ